MINISSNKQLDIILPNTNKALKEVLQSVSPKQLQLITQNKDLKSVINSLLKESSQNSANDKALLQLVKENPTLKNLGNVSNTIKDLLKSLDIKSNPTTQNAPLPIEKVYEPYFTTKHQSKGTGLGLFMSKMICEQGMSGHLDVVSKKGMTSFNIKIPLVNDVSSYER
jgi:nitrogen fixation/metabolism regulation signal transduction histidine kinase